MPNRNHEILKRTLDAIAEQAWKADQLISDAAAAGGSSHPVTIQAKVLRQELLQVKADLERELGRLVLDCTRCG